MSGLYIIPTPIGNLSDLSERVRQTIAEVDWIACEDTRVTGKLLQFLEIKKKMVSYRDQNEKEQAVFLADQLESGLSIGLICDAGTPGISDPGFRLVRECHLRKISVTPLPGPNAAITLLSASGLPTDRFLFVGFLAPKKSARIRFFETHRDFPYSIIFYESCHRIEKFISDALQVLESDRMICIGREITKKFETIETTSLQNAKDFLDQQSKKGEFVIILADQKFTL